MKKSLFILFLFFFGYQVYGQDEQCSGIGFNTSMAQDYGIPSNFEGGSVVVKVYFLSYANNNGTGGVSEAGIQSIFETLTNYYSGTGISFYYSPCETQFINNSALHASNDHCDFFDPVFVV